MIVVKTLWASVQGDPGVHAPRQRMAGLGLDRDDPHLTRDRVGEKRRLRLGALTLGARLRPVYHVEASR
jgi:hypothetical protein